MDDSLSIRARKKYKAQIEKMARERHIARFNKRMELAKLGVDAQKNNNLKAALQYYLAYIEVLSRGKGGGELTPKSFDPKVDAAEMLMLTGVYWDLAKIYDKFRTKDRTKVKYYLDKFVLFSKGHTYQKLSQEMVRKFLTYENPRSRPLFKEAYVKLGGGKCFIATAVEEHCEPDSIVVLKRFRDEVLNRNAAGRKIIQFYYLISPKIAIGLIRSKPGVQKTVAKVINQISSVISFRFFQGGR